MSIIAIVVNRWFKGHAASAISAATRPAVEPLERRVLLSGSAVGHEGVSLIQAGGRQIVVPQASHKPQAHTESDRNGAAARHGHWFAYPTLEDFTPDIAGAGGSASPSGVTNPTPIPGTLAPAQVLQAYGFSNVLLPNGAPATGAGETIGIVDAYDDPNIQGDLHTFDTQYFGGVDPNFTKVNLGSTATSNSPEEWELEESLDVEWAHAIAPQANILLVEAASNSYTNLTAAVDKAVSLGAQVVSMSWSGGENTSFDSHFAVPNVAFLASSGDSGAPGGWPAASPYVVGVGGTSLALNSNNNWYSEVGWYDGGGGISSTESRPSYQPTTYNNGTTSGIPLTNRGIPDVAYDAARESAMSVFDSFPHNKPNVFNGTETGWFAVGGTSAGTPQWAAMIALADQGRASAGLAPLGTAQILSTLYASAGDFHDIVGGTSVGSPNYSAAPGYDLVTGLGSPQAPLVVSSLIGAAPTTAPASPNGLWALPGNGTVSLQWNATSGASSWNIYRSTDGVNYTLYASVPGTSFVDSGLTNGAIYSYEVTAVNYVGESAPSQAVSAAPQVPPASPVLQSAKPTSNTFGQTDFNFGVTLQWSAVSGAASYDVLRSASSGGGYAVVAQGVAGVSYTDVSVYSATKYYYVIEAVGGAGAISANSNQLSATTIPSPPANLTATAGNSQIALSWSASTGAASYEIFRSTTSGSGYILVASNITSTSYTNTRLTNGKTYYYVVEAVNAGGPSANSNQASATPAGRARG